MARLIALLLHLFRLAAVTRHPIAGSSLRVVFDTLTGQQVLAADWKTDLPRLQAHLSKLRCGGVYLLVGQRNGRLRIRVGEGVKLWNRLGDHKSDPQLDFVREVYVLASPNFNKAATVYLQEQFSDIVQADPEIDCHKGCGHLADFPMSEDDRKALDLGVLLGLNLLNAAGLRCLSPAQGRLARRIGTLLAQGGVR